MPSSSSAPHHSAYPTRAPSYSYFQAPVRGDPWTRKIRAWQQREAKSRGLQDADRIPASTVAEPAAIRSALRAEFQRFRSHRRRQIARDLSIWLQGLASRHYVQDGVFDDWATLEGTLSRNGDDCDGLELLSYQLLRELGFGEEQVYRAIIRRPSDGLHHMVTLWFEDGSDPWVIDPTGAMTKTMSRMSDHTDWVPIKVFSGTEEFSVLAKQHRNEFARNQLPSR